MGNSQAIFCENTMKSVSSSCYGSKSRLIKTHTEDLKPINRRGFSTYYIESIHSEVYHTKQGHGYAWTAIQIPTADEHNYPICACNTEYINPQAIPEESIDSKKFATLYRSSSAGRVYHALKGHYAAYRQEYVPREKLGSCMMCSRCKMALDRVDYSKKYTTLYQTIDNPSVYHWDSRKCMLESSLIKKSVLTEDLYRLTICIKC